MITFAARGTVDVEHHDGVEGQLGPRGHPLELGQVLGALGPERGQGRLVQLGARTAGVEGEHHLLHVGGPLDVALYLRLRRLSHLIRRGIKRITIKIFIDT